MQEYRNPFQGIGAFFRSGSVLSILIIINVATWIAISFVRVPLFLTRVSDDSVNEFILQYLALPADPATLILRPWTLLTYMFLHIEFFHILFNMLWLYWFGKIFVDYLSSRKLLITYILGGISGGLLYILFFNTFPVFEAQRGISFALGASAAVMAIVTTIAFYIPNYSFNFIFIGKVKIIVIFIFLFVIDFFMIRSDNSGGHIAHIGGALFGILYATWIRRGFNIRELGDSFGTRRFRNVRTFDQFGKRRKASRQERPARTMNDDEYNMMKAEKQKKVDEILEKIKQSGYDSLTKAEKEFLFKESEK